MIKPNIVLKDYSGCWVENTLWARESVMGREMPVGIIAIFQTSKIMSGMRFVAMVAVRSSQFLDIFWGKRQHSLCMVECSM